ncbi:uncharacterized protein DUF4303 [Salana multivorans]|uniref:Uncharacterized protein DUF4303 n=1 Tax=Salana multivorans TaxID=120377 RepID=A0A3N2D144_9MICO|nr:DUF4303 domain-containing protein [Salana multivorans]ROR93499.1 uncharacterized protein DUF4303 [Salana multivorans]
MTGGPGEPGGAAGTDHVVVLLRERPPAAVLMRLHRLLRLGVTDVVRRVAEGAPLLDRGLFLNDRLPLAALLRDVLATVEPFAHELHVLSPGETPSPVSRTTADALEAMLATDLDAGAAVRPVPDARLAALVADATRAALAELPADVRAAPCAVALVTTGEGLRPYLSVTLDDDGRWDVGAGPYAVVGDAHLAAVADAWDARGHLMELDAAAADAELTTRLATMEQALRLLDVQGAFGAGDARRRTLLLVATMPPEATDAGFARRLNPAGRLLDRWLVEASECPALRPAAPSSRPSAGANAPGTTDFPAPVPALAELWRTCPGGLLLDDGTTVYGPDDLAERNETFEVAEYAPGWVLVGDDSGGSGYLMRRPGPRDDPAEGRAAAEVFRLGLGALTEDVATAGEFVTDDLVGWLAARQQDER